MISQTSRIPKKSKGREDLGKTVSHHVLSGFLGDVGDIVPTGLHELIQHNLGCLIIKLQEHLCVSFIVELICREGDHVGLGKGLPLPQSSYLVLCSFRSKPYLRLALP